MISCWFLFPGFPSSAQENFYTIDRVREIRIQFPQAGWKHLLDSLFQASGDEGRLIADVEIDGNLMKKVGVRYKGYSSWNLDEVKNPFNIDLDYCLKDQNYQGFTKLKLSNVIHDPSFVREALSYEIARDYLPASQANFAYLYINDTLIGLYTNVEAVDENLIENRFGSHGNSFFKGEPEKLEYPFGQNANLAYTHGTDSTGYQPFYKIESDEGWNTLLSLIYTLNVDTMNLESVLNIDRTLWMHAFNYVLLNLDSYIGYAQNYYLYRDDDGRFNPLVWDLNMAFGSFRESDGSTHFLGVSIEEMKTLDPLGHLYFSISPRPLMTVLFRNERYRKSYLAHIRTIVEEHFLDTGYIERARSLQQMIGPYVRHDTNKFYSDDDFTKNLTETVGGTGLMIQYPGIADLMSARAAYLLNYPGIRGEPVITEVLAFPVHPSQQDTVWIAATVSGAANVVLAYRHKGSGSFYKATMEAGRPGQDARSGNPTFVTGVPVSGDIFQYYIYAENDTAAAFSPARAEYEVYTVYPAIRPGELVINEVLVSGSSMTPDQDADPDPWIELYNTSKEVLNLHGLSLSDREGNVSGWFFPDTLLAPKNYLIVWADGHPAQEGLHTNFTIPASGGEVYLHGYDGIIIDQIVLREQIPGKSYGRYPNGYGSLTFMRPSFSANNFLGTTPGSGFLLYPNPANETIIMELKEKHDMMTVSVFNVLGRRVCSERIVSAGETGDGVVLPLDISGLQAGIYYVTISDVTGSVTGKFIKR